MPEPVTYPEADQIQQIIQDAQRILIIQADNPDGDSLGSALALEAILEDMGKEPLLYCGVDIPSYLTYMPGHDRVSTELPVKFDASIIVDTSSVSLLDQLMQSSEKALVAAKPCIVLDHHAVEPTIPFATVICNQKAVATGEVIYELAKQLGWAVPGDAANMIAISILADSLGLMTQATSSRSIHIIAELVERGVNLPELENLRRELMRKKPELVHYKGELLQRVEYHADTRIATVTIPFEEIEQYSPDYNPSMLVMEDMRLTTGTDIAIAFKTYKGNKMTAKIRCNYGKPIAGALAEKFGGGGHSYAAGFKVQDGRSFADVKADCIAYATELLDAHPAPGASDALV